jgi:pimeloyl-ACP methyl ester carboxylesterase
MKSRGRDRTEWLGRQDSNLGMAESKSTCFAFDFKDHSEKPAKFDPFPINRLDADSEAPPRHRRLGLAGDATDRRTGDVESGRHRLVQRASHRRFCDFAQRPRSHQRLFRLAVDFGAPRDYLAALGRSRKPAALLVGGADELFYPERFASLFAALRPDMPITIVPGIRHIGMTVIPAGIAAVRKSFLDLTAPAKG